MSLAIYVITDSRSFETSDAFVDHYRAIACDHRVTGVLLREPDMASDAYLRLVHRLADCGKLIVHSRNITTPQHAHELYEQHLCTAIHCAERDMDFLGAMKLPCSVSCHHPEQAQALLRAYEHLRFVTLSPIFPTPKPYSVTPLGISALMDVDVSLRSRVVALGGINQQTLSLLQRVEGLGGWAAIGCFLRDSHNILATPFCDNP
ncbi:thiamine monophosphate synthase [Desulfurispirillum indicum S5]|uniref:Thiamine monophosphate synthase n=1 Tax=Desulfurispirillum indicum (strain ATCC BAA-1389 / DSM 22839 / S5) TaxID=653733 RepID=E6W5J2_DESIS|nr:thiamine phosphate synthase [Desulfurispirillum indicum]ADU66023.1 thiamine monophosphate synthase [Desulfurispirillum indicum S5]